MIITCFDTETTGLLTSGLLELDKAPEIIEFMAMKIDLETGETIKEYEFLCKPKRPVSEETTKITSITKEMLANEKPFSAYIDDVRDALENCDAVIAHNLAFDKEMVDIEMLRNNQSMVWPEQLICTVERSVPLKGYRISLKDLHKEFFGEEFSGAHRARNDVVALVKCVKGLNTRGFI